MSDNTDGGPAFPLETDRVVQPGMMLRDYFAAAALTGLMAERSDFRPDWQKQTAWRAYSVADAMLAQRDMT